MKDDHCVLTVWGTAGQMGKALENDSAIVKAAWIADRLYSHMDASQISLANNIPGTLVLEGGQGFLPTHTIEDVKQRMINAISQSYSTTREEYLGLKQPILSFEKLHNDAFSRSVDSKEMELGLFVGRLLNIPNMEPVVGFPVSCDARIFAHEYPDKQVITVGPGTIAYAHTDNEQITEKELTTGALQLALNILLMTGTCVPNDFLQ
jgi:acetylornithine deacetylase/succinyl-diaminopimelate desuccinylase-like protein